jgi:hypothetical protein
MKALQLEALDGSKWLIPLSAIVDNYARFLQTLADFAHDPWEAVREHAEKRFEGGSPTAADWARGDMNWADVKAVAVQVKAPDPLDMEDSWTNGKMRVIECEAIPAGDPVRTFAPVDTVVGVPLTQEQVDGLVLSLKAARALSLADMLAIYHGMKDEAPTILAGVQPGDHGDAILAAYGQRVIKAAIEKAAGLA